MKIIDEDPVFRREIPYDQLISVGIMDFILNVSEAERGDLPPLWNRIDPETIDDLISHADTESSVVFRDNDYLISVTAGSEIRLYSN